MSRYLWIVLLCSYMLFGSQSIKSITPTPSTINVSFIYPIDTTRLKSDDMILKEGRQVVEGRVDVSEHNTTLSFIPKRALGEGSYHLILNPITFTKKENVLCQGFFNRINAYLCSKFSVRCDHICYEEQALRSEELNYPFAIDKELLHVRELQIQTIANLDESQSVEIRVVALMDDNRTKDITSDVTLHSTSPSVADIVDHRLNAINEGTTTLKATYKGLSTSKEINVFINIDGHRLPHEVDEALNRATLTGIDANNNGVRDDVERWIYLEMETFNGYIKIEREIAMQNARGKQMVFTHPDNEDDVVVKAMDTSLDCWVYYANSKGIPLINSGIKQFFRDMEDKVYNTKERHLAYMRYNHSLSGRIFKAVRTLDCKYQCQFDIETLLGE